MSKRFLANISKYRNAVGKAAKHEEAYTDLKPSTNATTDTSQLVKVSQNWIAYKHASLGTVGILPVGTVGRVGADVHLLNAHGAGVSDWEFSPFDSNVLITGSDNGEIKVWQISAEGESITTELTATIITGTGKTVDAIVHHPSAHGIVATTSTNLVQIWDYTDKAQGATISSAAHTLTHPNAVFSMSWKGDGTLLATTCKDTQIRVFDPRLENTPIHTGQGPAGNRPSRVVWLGEKDLLFTLGFNKMRERENAVWNATDLSQPLEIKRLDSSSGIALPLYDEDTSILFLPSRGESIIRWMEISESAPFMTEGIAFSAQGPVAGSAFFPKQVLRVMQTEVVRLLTVNTNGLWPISVSIPRRTYLDFHADLYPETKSAVPGLEASEWLQGENKPVPRMSLDPGAAGKPEWIRRAIWTASPKDTTPVPAVVQKQPTPAQPTPIQQKAVDPVTPTPQAPVVVPVSQSSKSTPEPVSAATTESITTGISSLLTTQRTPGSPKAEEFLPTPTPVTPEAVVDNRLHSVSTQAGKTSPPPSTPSTATPVRASPLASRFGAQKASRFRFLTFKPYHVSEYFDNMSGLSISTAPECSMIEVNPKFIALPLNGSGGRIGILKTSEPGRVGTKIPSLVCSSDLTGFKFDPFNHNLLITASDDTKIKGWIIPEDGIDSENDATKPNWVLSAPSMDKISLVLFHPRAKDVLLSASMDRSDPTIRLWNLKTQEEKLAIKGHKDVIFSCDFNHQGDKIVSVCKDKKIRIWNALTGDLIQEGKGHDSLRSCRVIWLGESDVIASVGFGRGSQREILLYDATDLGKGPIESKKMDASPGILVPHYDSDTSVLGISARGDRVMKHFEIDVTSPAEFSGKSRFVDVASLEQGSLQQDVAYLPKRYCNVKEIELAKMYRLTYNSVEVIRVSVPRNKKEFFQDDLFPDTVDVETSSLEAADFFAGKGLDVAPRRINLCPSDMESLAHHQEMTPATPQSSTNSLDKFLQGKQQAAEDDRKKEAMERMFETAKESKADRDTLVPDTGIIADDEWDD
ncbi:Coronin-7 [Mortierella hygrophila]|uniref:Coronin n=1 Tax=Mortierella hygrophila TaxID=979708 RepID=A0A9P6K0Q9_9FUNG|nr:Coronin-7 [Mortierella hygrophila]